MRHVQIFLSCSALAALVSVSAAPLPIQTIGSPWTAAARTTEPAYIIVQLSNPDGTPKIDAELPKANPASGVELKGSKWSFDTFQIPVGFEGTGVQAVPPKSFLDKPGTQTVRLPGQLRVTQIAPAFRLGDAKDPRAGSYYFTVLPMFGVAGGQKKQLPWISGHYVFRITYRDGANSGTALGEFVIP